MKKLLLGITMVSILLIGVSQANALLTSVMEPENAKSNNPVIYAHYKGTGNSKLQLTSLLIDGKPASHFAKKSMGANYDYSFKVSGNSYATSPVYVCLKGLDSYSWFTPSCQGLYTNEKGGSQFEVKWTAKFTSKSGQRMICVDISSPKVKGGTECYKIIKVV